MNFLKKEENEEGKKQTGRGGNAPGDEFLIGKSSSKENSIR
jgi:hypothetical protein